MPSSSPDLKIYFDTKTSAQWIVIAQTVRAIEWLHAQRRFVVAVPAGCTASVLHKDIGEVLIRASNDGLSSVVF